MAYFNGNQYLFASGAANNNTNNFSNGFAPGSNNNMGHTGAYGTTPNFAPTYGGAYHTPPQTNSMGYSESTQPMAAGMNTTQQQQQAVSTGYPGPAQPMSAGTFINQQPSQRIPMGHPGLPPPMFAGINTNQQMRPSVAQHPGTWGVSTAYAPPPAFMPHGMRTGMHMHMAAQEQSTTIRFPVTGISMAPGPQYAPQQAGMRMNPPGVYQPPVWPSLPPQALSAQLSTRVSAPSHEGHGAFNTPPALTGNNAAIAPAARRAAPAEIIDLTNDDDEPVGAAPTIASNMPAPQHAGTKRARADSTLKKSSTPVKKPRYTRIEASALPTPPSSSSAVQAPSSSSFSSASSAEVLPVTPCPVKQQPARREKRADPHNLLGGIYHTFMAKPANRYVAQPDGDEAEKITRPVYTADIPKKGRSGKQPKKTLEPSTPKSKPPSKRPKTPEPAAPSEADGESDAEFELDDEYGAPTVLEPTAPAVIPPFEEQQQESATTSGSDALTTSHPAEETDDAIAFDDDGQVICRPDGMPMSLTEWNAQQAAATSGETLVHQEPGQSAVSLLVEDGGSDDEGDDALAAQLAAALEVVVSEESAQRTPSPLSGSDDEDGGSDDEGDDALAAQLEAFLAESDGEVSEKE